MADFDTADPDRIIRGEAGWLDETHLTRLVEHPLACVDTEYPHFVMAVDGLDDIAAPSSSHPIFYGCFDWHSAVHSHWSLVRQLRLWPDHPQREAVIAAIDPRMRRELAADEAAYLEAHPTFERPYGWGWLLRLCAELSLWDDPVAERWRDALEPLETAVATLVEERFLTMPWPQRVGTHGNAAFGLACTLDYARVVGADELEAAAADTARTWFIDDEGYPIGYEPLGWDFLSPGLQEAEVMARVLDEEAFADWFDRFLPSPAVIDDLEPLAVDTDDADGMALHLVGLDLSRAWMLASLAETVDVDSLADRFAASAQRHGEAGLSRAFIDDYDGSHWLTSFALYLLTRREGGIWPRIN